MPYTLYPNVVSKIKTALKKNGLTVLSDSPEVFVQKKLRFYHAVCQNKKGKKVFFKSILKRERGIRNRFLNEINFLIEAGKNPRLDNITSPVLDFSLKPSFLYFICQFLPGKSKTRKDRFSEEEIKEAVRLMLAINSQGVRLKLIPKKPLFNFPYYQRKISFFLRKIGPGMKRKTRRKIKGFIEKNKKIFYLVEPRLTHGDFSEANLIFYRKGVKIVDWEHVHYRNPLYDFVSFWTKRKEYKREQKIMEREYLKNDGKSKFFPTLFRLGLIEMSLSDLVFFQEMLRESKGNRKIREARKKEFREALGLLEREI